MANSSGCGVCARELVCVCVCRVDVRREGGQERKRTAAAGAGRKERKIRGGESPVGAPYKIPGDPVCRNNPRKNLVPSSHDKSVSSLLPSSRLVLHRRYCRTHPPRLDLRLTRSLLRSVPYREYYRPSRFVERTMSRFAVVFAVTVAFSAVTAQEQQARKIDAGFGDLRVAFKVFQDCAKSQVSPGKVSLG